MFFNIKSWFCLPVIRLADSHHFARSFEQRTRSSSRCSRRSATSASRPRAKSKRRATSGSRSTSSRSKYVLKLRRFNNSYKTLWLYEPFVWTSDRPSTHRPVVRLSCRPCVELTRHPPSYPLLPPPTPSHSLPPPPTPSYPLPLLPTPSHSLPPPPAPSRLGSRGLSA